MFLSHRLSHSTAGAGTVLSANDPGLVVPLTAVSIQLPQSLPAHSIYFLYEVNTDGSSVTYSQPYVINQPQVWWTDQNNAYVGGKVSLFGTNLSYDVTPASDQSWLYLFPSGSGTTIILPVYPVAPSALTGSGAMDVNPYKIDFNLPDGLLAGTYNVQVYNGHGGVNGISNYETITIAAAPLTATYTLQTAYDNFTGGTGFGESDGLIDPAAVNDAIKWATGYANSSSLSYVTIQLPAGTIQVGSSTNEIKLYRLVHLVGAGDTGNPATGTIVEGTASPLSLQDLITLYAPQGYLGPGYISAQNGIANMSIDANGSVYDAVIHDDYQIATFTIQNVTIDATSDNPALQNTAQDVAFTSDSSNLQFLDSTFIGGGISINATACSVDNCHFVGCGASGAQINESAPSSDLSDFSLTRSSDLSLINNITSPGGNVEYDAACRLFADYDERANLYVGVNTASDMYPVPEIGSNVNGGEVISTEPQAAYGSNSNIAIYQNTVSGDGAESFLGNSSGVSVQGVNTVVDDNEFSRLAAGIQFYDPSGPIDTGAFAIATNNSIYHVHNGINLVLFDASVAPQIYCSSFSDNLINGIGFGPTLPLNPPAAAIAVTSFLSTDDTPPQYLMNIFNDNIITGAFAGFAIYNAFGIQLGGTVLSNNFFSSDGSINSYECDVPAGLSENPIIISEDMWQGFWLSYP